MTTATRDRDAAHARIYRRWLDLPAWRTLTPTARVALVTLLALYHPTRAPYVATPVRDLARSLGASKATAAQAIADLVDRGWLEAVTPGGFRPRRLAVYRWTLYPDPNTSEPGSRAFEAFGSD